MSDKEHRPSDYYRGSAAFEGESVGPHRTKAALERELATLRADLARVTAEREQFRADLHRLRDEAFSERDTALADLARVREALATAASLLNSAAEQCDHWGSCFEYPGDGCQCGTDHLRDQIKAFLANAALGPRGPERK